MAKTIRFEVNQKELDSNNVILQESDFVYSVSYTATEKVYFSLASNNTYTPINFNQVTSGTALKITTSQTVSIKLNSGAQELVVSGGTVYVGTVTGLTIKNNSGSASTIIVEIYGT